MIRSSENVKRKKRAKHVGDDIINQLPDEILISIISRLPLREATATSILSTRWRYLSTYTARLDFPPFEYKSSYEDHDFESMLRRRFPRYINTIDRVLDSHNGSRVKEFRVHTYCLEGVNIEKWFEFALAKGAEIIDIDMKFLRDLRARRGRYCLQLVNLMMRVPFPSPPALKCLKQCSLSGIHVDGVDIELLLSNSHLLESLSIAYAVELVSLKCYQLPRTYSLRLNNVPKLSELSTNDQKGLKTLLEILLRMPASIRDQLQTLELRVNLFYWMAYEQTLLPKLKSMKHLEIHTVLHMDDIRLLSVIHVIQACPSLETLHIKEPQQSWKLLFM